MLTFYSKILSCLGICFPYVVLEGDLYCVFECFGVHHPLEQLLTFDWKYLDAFHSPYRFGHSIDIYVCHNLKFYLCLSILYFIRRTLYFSCRLAKFSKIARIWNHTNMKLKYQTFILVHIQLLKIRMKCYSVKYNMS